MKNKRPPEKGIKYALYKTKIVFESYQLSSEEVQNLQVDELDCDDLLELHMFDEHEEYRLLKTRMNGRQELLISDDIPHDDVYVEEVYLLNKTDADNRIEFNQTVKVVNYISYDENDLLRISAYRLQEVK